MINADQLLVKAAPEQRYTLGVLYAPDHTDLHGEWTTDQELHKAVIAYSMQPDKRLRLQHNVEREVGTVVELMRWPYSVEVDTYVGGMQKRATLAAGTVFLGAIWDEEYWPLVKAGKIRGYSMGGRALRVREGGTGSAEFDAGTGRVVKSRGALFREVSARGGIRLT